MCVLRGGVRRREVVAWRTRRPPSRVRGGTGSAGWPQGRRAPLAGPQQRTREPPRSTPPRGGPARRPARRAAHHADALARLEARPALPHDDLAGERDLPVRHLRAQVLGITVRLVLSRASLLLGGPGGAARRGGTSEGRGGGRPRQLGTAGAKLNAGWRLPPPALGAERPPHPGVLTFPSRCARARAHQRLPCQHANSPASNACTEPDTAAPPCEVRAAVGERRKRGG